MSCQYNTLSYSSGYLPGIDLQQARQEQIGALGSKLPLGARMSNKWASNSYSNFIQAQTWPAQVTYSGSQICSTCPPNYSAINIPSASPSMSVAPGFRLYKRAWYPVVDATASLPPVQLSRFGPRSFGLYRGDANSRGPFMEFLPGHV
jgi:hypothetical protein